jgi:hypothetical protein
MIYFLFSKYTTHHSVALNSLRKYVRLPAPVVFAEFLGLRYAPVLFPFPISNRNPLPVRKRESVCFA